MGSRGGGGEEDGGRWRGGAEGGMCTRPPGGDVPRRSVIMLAKAGWEVHPPNKYCVRYEYRVPQRYSMSSGQSKY